MKYLIVNNNIAGTSELFFFPRTVVHATFVTTVCRHATPHYGGFARFVAEPQDGSVRVVLTGNSESTRTATTPLVASIFRQYNFADKPLTIASLEDQLIFASVPVSSLTLLREEYIRDLATISNQDTSKLIFEGAQPSPDSDLDPRLENLAKQWAEMSHSF